jgi:cytochrome c-type protein NapC
MAEQDGREERSGQPRHFLWRKPRTRWLLGIPAGGFLLFFVGVAAWAAFNTGLQYSNSLQFCTSCHEMQDNIVAGYEKGPHAKNMAGVRAICSDCHVPHAFIPKMQAKIAASFNELPKWALGTVGTREKFQAVQLQLAEHVWAKMKATDSRECKNCHSLESMDLEAQDPSAAKKHIKERMLARDETCIDCHKGVGHGLPPGYEG